MRVGSGRDDRDGEENGIRRGGGERGYRWRGMTQCGGRRRVGNGKTRMGRAGNDGNGEDGE